MDKTRIIDIFEGIDNHLSTDAELCIYGSGAFILLDEDDRTSIDIDIAGPYSNVNFKDLQKAAKSTGVAINPDEPNGDHIEWVSLLRLCLAEPTEKSRVILWTGDKLTVFTVAPEDLVASKLIRYDDIDQGDIHYLVFQMNIIYSQIVEAVNRLPVAFRDDVMLQENLLSLKVDIDLWRAVT